MLPVRGVLVGTVKAQELEIQHAWASVEVGIRGLEGLGRKKTDKSWSPMEHSNREQPSMSKNEAEEDPEHAIRRQGGSGSADGRVDDSSPTAYASLLHEQITVYPFR